MRSRRWPVLGTALVAVLAVCGTALGVGPWPGLARTVEAPSGDVRYSATRAEGTTKVRALSAGRVVASATFDGAYGIPAVTSTGVAGGLSPDGRLLVLAQPPSYEGLRERSRFLLVSTKTLSVEATIVLQGEFGFDAISPNRRFVYLIQHTSASDLVRYLVRAYDLQTRRLLPGVIADKGLAGAVMRGYPVARAASTRGVWVYTLYFRNTPGGLPFVHALNAAGRTAFCVDLPSWPKKANIWNARLELKSGQLLVRVPGRPTVATIDTTTLQVL
jgi:hypothetical protein